MLAVIQTGGKQYLVKVGERIQIEKIKEKEGEEVVFDKVLLVEKQNKVQIGTPYVKGAKVIGKVLEHKKGKKNIVFKYKPKKRYRKKQGHRQPYTIVEIKKIET